MSARLTKAQRDELRWLRKAAAIAEKMTAKLDFAAVEKHARERPGTIGPGLSITSARTRDLMTALHMAGIARRALGEHHDDR